MSAREVPARTRAQQAKVSDPGVSAWVSANAGAGKTTVLVRRVIRLLLAGNAPARILCLTFTKAAAANMANKVLQTLGKWALLDDDALDAAIREVSALEPSAGLRARARRLFATAIETPGGLRVQTMHAFCDRVLHQFPFEAGVQAGFDVLDEVREADLVSRARQAVLIEAARDRGGRLGRALAHAVTVASDMTLEEALIEAVRDRRKVLRLAEAGGDAAVAAALGLRAEDTLAATEKEILTGGCLPRGEWAATAAALHPFGGNAARCATRLREAAAGVDDATAIRAYLSVFLKDDGEPRSDGGFGNSAAREGEPALFARLFEERARLIPLRDRLLAAQARERTAALAALAQATIDRYEAQKRARGALDYGDLIEKTAAMFDAYASNWVLYKLDGGIDHVLIDEAQDTSPEQWRVVERLTEEFFAGKGAREDRTRTIFAVGDEKQSIFSFQGADPKEFGRMRGEFERTVAEAGKPFAAERLDLSFRSLPGVLDAIDNVFARPDAFKGLTSGDETKTVHEAIREKAPALVEIWPTEKPEPEDDAVAWDAPLDAQRESGAVVRLALHVAAAVKHWTRGGLAVGDAEHRRAARAGDVIVLVRQRGALFDAILQALKRAEVPVAGADRLKLTEHIAVMDLMALGDALTLDADDLALACALKSPLFGLTEDELFALAHPRRGPLAAALIEKGRTDLGFGAAAEKFRRWKREAADLRPFDFYSRVLGRDKGREHMLARLGIEAADALDEFLARALAYEQTETPSLTGFLAFLRRAGTEVKRDLEVEGNAVRVMTVHGAKGLEAPIVVLAETTSLPDGRQADKLIPLGDSGAFAWGLAKAKDSIRLGKAREAAREAREAEYRRLLYVALTRAADALVVCGYESKQQGRSGPPEGCWYRLVREALKDKLVECPAPYGGPVWRWRPEEADKAPAETSAAPAVIKVPGWLREKAAPVPPAPPRIVPSQFDPDEERPRAGARLEFGALDPRRRGDLVHRLLRYLPDVPAGDREAAAHKLLSSAAGDLDDSIRAALADEAMRVAAHEELAEVFGADSRAESDFLARAAGGVASDMSGKIDRFAVTDSNVIVADFKTGKPPAPGEDAPVKYVQQVAVYCDVLARVFPGRAMRGLLVWTAGPTIHRIEAERLQSALRATAGRLTPP